MTRFPNYLLLSLLGVITVGVQSGTPGPARVADTIVPTSSDPITLSMPTGPSMASAVAERLLASAGVRYGFEGPPVSSAAPGIDLAHYGESALTLSGQRLGAALDAIALAVPQIRWTETDGAIVVRANSGQTFLDRKIDRFSVTAANPRALLETLLLALDPSRRGQGIVGFGRPGGGGAMNTPAGGRGRDVTVTLTNVTVGEILTTAARLNGALSWAVKYDGAPADYDHASIALAESGEPVTALSPAVLRSNPLAAPATFGTTRTPPIGPGQYQIYASIGTMVTTYAVRNSVRVGVEELPQPQASATAQVNLLSVLGLSPAIPGLPPIDLNGLSSADAMRHLVALDSRYELSESGGHFLVRPKPGVKGRLDVLDQAVDGFTASREPANEVMLRIARQIGASRSAPRLPSMTSPFGVQLATPIDIALSGRVPVRRVLDAIGDGSGLVWSMRPALQPGSSTRIELVWRGPSGSSSMDVTLAEDLAPAPTASRKPSTLVPASLDRTIVRFTFDSNDPATHPFEQLGRMARAPLGIELLPPPEAGRDPRLRTRALPELVVGPGSFSDALYLLLERHTDYDVVSVNGVISLAPTVLVRDSGYFMNRRIDRFVATNEPFYRAVGRVRQLVNPSYTPTVWNGSGASTMNRPVTVSLERVTIREIMNAIAAAHGGMMWTSRFEAATPSDQAQARDSDWVLVLFPIDVATPPVRVEPLDSRGVARPRAPLAVPTPERRPDVGVILDLPITPFRAKYAIQQLTRSTNRPAGIEMIVDANTPMGTTPQYYDLTGLPMAEALAKIASMMPGYSVDDAGGVMHLRPTALVNDPANWLNQKVDRFERRFDMLPDAMNAVAAIQPVVAASASQRPAPRPVGPPSTRPSTLPASVQAQLVTSITIAMTNVTVREILDEIARQHGSLAWSVDHRQDRGTLSLSFSTLAWTGFATIR